MAKKKRRNNDDGYELMSDERAAFLAAALLGLGSAEARVRTVSAEEALARAKALGDYDLVRVIASTACAPDCPLGADLVVVGAYNAATLREAESDKRLMTVMFASGHGGGHGKVILDAEDAKQLVNALSECIAAAEAVTA